MTYGAVADKARLAAAWCVALLGLTIPLSTALDGVLSAILLIAWVLALPRDFHEWRKSFASIPPVLAAASLFGLLLIGCFYSGVTWKVAWSSAMKYADLALLGVLLWAAYSGTTRRRALYLFIFAIVLNLIVSYAAANSLIDRLPGMHTQPHYPVGFKLSVTHGILVSFGAFVCLLLAREARTTAVRAPLVGLALLCAHNVLFIVIGRTGYVVLPILLAYCVATALRGWRLKLIALIVIAALLPAAYYGSGNFQERVDEVTRDLTRWKPGAGDETSVGQRIGYYRTTLELIAEHPLTGVGTGGYAPAYAGKVRGTEAPATTHPHNDYLMIGAQVGIPGIALLLLLYGVIWHTAPKLRTRLERDIARGLVLTMVVSGLFNSVLLDHTEGLFFAWVTALLYARYTPDEAAGSGAKHAIA